MGVLDVIAFGVTLFGLAILLFCGVIVLNYMSSDTTVFNQSFTANGTTVNFMDYNARYFSMFDWFFLLMMVVLALGMVILGYALPSHPIFFIVAIVGLMIWLFVAPYLSNTFITLTDIPVFGAAAANLPYTSIALYYLPVIGFIVGVIGAIYTYGKGGYGT